MVRYAEAECATCYAVRPKNEMREVRIRQKSTSSYRSFWGFKTGNRNFSSRDSYRHQRAFVCLTCKAPKSDSGIGTFSTLVWLGALGGGAILLVPSLLGVASRTDPADESTPIESANPPPEITPTVPSEPIDETSSERSRVETTFDFDSQFIADKEIAAASTGTPQSWEIDGISGSTVPSELQALSGKECRSVYSIVDATGLKSGIATYCRPDGGGWHIEN